MKELKKRLDAEYAARNNECELSFDKPDPLLIAKKYNNESIALACALFAYGNAKQIVKFLSSLDFHNEDLSVFDDKYYRFQTPNDTKRFFAALRELEKEGGVKTHFLSGYKTENSVLDGLKSVIGKLNSILKPDTQGLDFLVGRDEIKENGSPLKRWNMYLRWMVRKDCLDMGLWDGEVSRSDLILPLDTHTFNVSKRLGLLDRKSYDLRSAILITQKLREFDKDDPIKYDFALYRIGQEKLG
ncbi:MAG: TIGR02757 family protein [Campylobacterales bacterium]|nr:TIGR02757 family protein [Campylobacterales bacterium]